MILEADELDPDVVLSPNSLPVYRLVKSRYADLSGVGAALAPGRWNKVGEQALYTSLDRATAVLEKLAHTSKELIPEDLVMLTIQITGDWIRGGRVNVSSASRGVFVAFPDLASTGSAHTRSKQFKTAFAVAVPSVVVTAWNVVLYPQRVGFWEHVSMERSRPFSFDPRLFPESSKAEPNL